LPPPSFLAVSAVVNAGLAPGVPRDRGGRVSGGIKCVGGWTGPQFLNVDATPPLPRIVSWPARQDTPMPVRCILVISPGSVDGIALALM
jgi:hypothetical protein